MTGVWRAWPRLRARLAAADEITLFLDYDGTLAPIARHPSKARLPGATRRQLARLARAPGIWTAIVSGRSLEDVQRAVRLRRLCYVGNHGLEVAGQSLRYVNPAADACRPRLAQIRQRLQEVLRPIPGAWVEDKQLTLTVHFRGLAVSDVLILKQRVDDVVHPLVAQRLVRVTPGKCILELHPPVRWTKGTIVRWLLARRRAVPGAGRCLPVYLGDDVTDEEAFAALARDGVTIAVGPAPATTAAQYGIRTPREVCTFLQRLAAVRRATCPHAA